MCGRSKNPAVLTFSNGMPRLENAFANLSVSLAPLRSKIRMSSGLYRPEAISFLDSEATNSASAYSGFILSGDFLPKLFSAFFSLLFSV